MAKDKTFETCSANDPAIDKSRMTRKAMHAFGETRDMKHLVLKPGMTRADLTIYSYRLVPQRFWDWADSGEEDGPKFSRSFRACLRSVTNMRNEDGTTMSKEPWVPAMDPDDCLSAESMERFDRIDIREMGGVMYVKSFFGKQTPPSYPLPPLLAAHLNGCVYLPADASPSLPVENKPAASAASEATPAQ